MINITNLSIIKSTPGDATMKMTSGLNQISNHQTHAGHCTGHILSLSLFLLSLPVFAQTPAAPTGLTVTAASGSAIGLSWTAPAGETNVRGYNVYRCESPCTLTTDDFIAWVSNGAGDPHPAPTQYTDSSVTFGSTYIYAVGASVGTGYTATPWSNNLTVTAAPPPGPPTGLKVISTGVSAISLGWSAPADDDYGALLGYNVYRCVDGETPCELQWIAWVGSRSTTAYTDGNVTQGTTYRYAVGASRGEGAQSAWSNQVTATAEAGSAHSGTVVVEETPDQLADDPLAQPDYLPHYGSVAPVFTINDSAGLGTLSAGSAITLSGSMTLQGNNHRDDWDDRLVLAVGTGNGPASQNHPYAGSFGYAGENDKVYALAVSIAPVGNPDGDGSRPPIKVIDARGRRDITSSSTRRSPTVVWELSVTLASTWKDYSTGDNTGQDNGRGIERHEHSYTLKLDLDYDETFETTLTGTFKTYQAESIGVSVAVQQGEARAYQADPDNADGPPQVNPDLDTWNVAARAINAWAMFTESATTANPDLYPANPAPTSLTYDTDAAGHEISGMLFGTNAEHFITEDRYWDNYTENSEMVGLMKDRPVSWIRFPGGESTTQYHFDLATATMSTTARWGIDEWDTSRSAELRTPVPDSDFMDFEEFSKVIKHTGAIPFVGLNLQSAYHFRALELDKIQLDSNHTPPLTRQNFNDNYNSTHIQDGLDQARDVAQYMDQLGLNVRYWYLDNESNLANYGGVWVEHYTLMARDYIDKINRATGRSDNEFIANWTNTGFIKDYGWKKILDTIGDNLGYIDFHTYWWVYGGSWGLNDPVKPQTNEPNPDYGVSTWEAWKSQLPMQWENIDNDSHDYNTRNPLSARIGSALTQKTSLAEYFRTIRDVLDDNNYENIKIMIGEWGIAPRGHSRLDPNRYQLTVMLAEYFMQMISSGAVDAAAGWPFSSRGGNFVSNLHNVLHKPDGTNEVVASYTMQKLFNPFIDAEFLPVTSGVDGVIAVGAYKGDEPSLHIAILNKTGQERTVNVPVGGTFNKARIRRMQPADDPGEYDNTYGTVAPVFETGALIDVPEPAAGGTAARQVSVSMKPWSLAWVSLSHRLDPVPGFTAGAGANAGEITLSWNAVSGATGYEIRYRASQTGTRFSDPILVSGGSATTYTLTGLTSGQNYIVRVRAVSSGTDISSDAIISGVAAAAGFSVALPAPVVRATPGDGLITLHWHAVPGAMGYQVRYREAVEGAEFSDYIDVVNATYYVLDEVQGTYIFRVRAVSQTEFSSEYNTGRVQTN